MERLAHRSRGWRLTGLDPYLLGAMVGRQLPFFSLIVPFWLIWTFAGGANVGDLAGNPGVLASRSPPVVPLSEFHQPVDRRYRRLAHLDGVSHPFLQGVAGQRKLWSVAGAAQPRRLR